MFRCIVVGCVWEVYSVTHLEVKVYVGFYPPLEVLAAVGFSSTLDFGHVLNNLSLVSLYQRFPQVDRLLPFSCLQVLRIGKYNFFECFRKLVCESCIIISWFRIW